ncbi:hypothetical protein [Haladaptatus halobius]|uniref:hypothetical protein n=1 Tax=Haladaptatus halobius TaxID=2884875 RepID=UPI001D0AC2A9|nr:hypothetical protein [Haladaptatus halobius]
MLTYASWDSSRRFALLGGCVLSLVTLVLFVVVFPAYNYGRTSVAELLWYTVGAFSLGVVTVSCSVGI